MKKFLISLFKLLAVCAFWVRIWYLVARRVNSELLFPSPAAVWEALKELTVTKQFWLTTLISLCRILYGILISLVIGCGLAVITSVSSVLRSLLAPLMTAIKAVPVACFIILMLLWIKTGTLPVFITVLIVIPIVWSNVTEGILSTDKKLCEVAEVFKLSYAKKLFKLYIPSVMPYFMAACRSALGMAWKAGVAAEVLAVPQNSIGKEIYFSKTYLETPTLFAWTVVIIILSCLIEKSLVFALEKVSKKLHVMPRGDRHANA